MIQISNAAAIFLDHLRNLNVIARDRLLTTAQEEADRERKLRLAWKSSERIKSEIFGEKSSQMHTI